MRAVDVIVAPNSSEASRAEVISNCCPQDFQRFKQLPKVCDGDLAGATLMTCEKCWYQEVREDAGC